MCKTGEQTNLRADRHTDRQTVLELQHGKPIKEIITDLLKAHPGEHLFAARVALEMNISTGTLYKWALEMDIDLNEYRYTMRAAVAAGDNG